MPITRRELIPHAAAATAAFTTACSPRRKRPNVLFLLTDDQRWDALSCAGHPFLRTPHIDRLAQEGARFANAFCTTSLCSPSRASYLSGLYAHAHGVVNNFTDYPRDLDSFPRRLKQAGYSTAYIGKWHMGEEDDSPRPGFDYWASHRGQGKYFDTEFNVNNKRSVIKGYYTHTVTNLALDWLRRHNPARPFSLILGHKAPHGLWQPEPKYERVFDNIPIEKPKTATDTGAGKPDYIRKRVRTWHGIEGPLYGAGSYEKFVRTYLATILSVDDSVGAVYDQLRRSGELDNTILVFAGDNGFMLGEHGAIDKRTMYEESIRVPLLFRYPEAIRTPRVVNELALNVDLAPTLLDLCGLDPLPRVHGASLRGPLAGSGSDWRKSIYYSYDYEREFPYTPNVRGVRTQEWKYVRYPNGPGLADTETAELYHLAADPLETRNLIDAPEAQEQLASLRTELESLQRATGATDEKMPRNPQLLDRLPDEKIR